MLARLALPNVLTRLRGRRCSAVPLCQGSSFSLSHQSPAVWSSRSLIGIDLARGTDAPGRRCRYGSHGESDNLVLPNDSADCSQMGTSECRPPIAPSTIFYLLRAVLQQLLGPRLFTAPAGSPSAKNTVFVYRCGDTDSRLSVRNHP